MGLAEKNCYTKQPAKIVHLSNKKRSFTKQNLNLLLIKAEKTLLIN